MAFSRLRLGASALVCMAGLAGTLAGQTSKTNLDEAAVRSYTLPALLADASGKPVRTRAQWGLRRAYLLNQFAETIYGRMPAAPPGFHAHVDRVDSNVLNGKASRSEITLYLGPTATSPAMHVLLYLPTHAGGKVPVFVGLNFLGNHSTTVDPAVTVQPNWLAAQTSSTPPRRGIQASRWPFEQLVDAGYGVATAWYGDVEVDTPVGWKLGIRSTLAEPLHIQPQEWGAVGAWAWGMSRIQDYLLTNPAVDARRIIVTGHSRLGKAALWAGVNDTRFAMVVSNDSGEGGAALARRNFGETTEDLNRNFPHWFVQHFRDFNDKPDAMPVDQHELLALIAPRPLYVASATEDLWSDPKGEFLSAQAANPVYELFGYRGLEGSFPPPADTSVGSRIGYHLRTGKHDMTPFDWQQYVAFADRTLSPLAH